jgi:hypothetical protein
MPNNGQDLAQKSKLYNENEYLMHYGNMGRFLNKVLPESDNFLRI